MYKPNRNNLYDNGMKLSDTGDLLISEPMLSEVMEDVGEDIYDADTIDSSKVMQLASEIGLTNLGSFGDLAGACSDEFLFYMSVMDIEEYERQVRHDNQAKIKVLEEVIKRAESYL